MMIAMVVFVLLGISMAQSTTVFAAGSTRLQTSDKTIKFKNPLSINSVEGVLSNVLTVVQGIVGVLALVFIVVGGIIYITSAGDSGRTELAKKAITAAIIGLALAFAAPSLLRELYAVLGAKDIPGQAQTALTLTQIAMNVLKVLLGFIGALSVLMLVVGGIIYMSSAGDEGRSDMAKKTITYAIIGLIVALSALIIVKALAGVFAP